MIKKQIDVRQFDLNFQESNGLHDLEIQQFTTKNQQGNTRSFNFKMFLNKISQLKHIQLTKHMHYCIQIIYHVHSETQWDFIILNKLSHMTVM